MGAASAPPFRRSTIGPSYLMAKSLAIYVLGFLSAPIECTFVQITQGIEIILREENTYKGTLE